MPLGGLYNQTISRMGDVKHTSGPWVTDTHNGPLEWAVETEDGKVQICNTSQVSHRRTPEANAERTANARLIAQAPTLKACVSSSLDHLRWLHEHLTMGDHDADQVLSLEICIAACESTLSKANGNE